MNNANMQVLINTIGAVESGNQVYGNRNYSAYAAPYTSTPNEHTITLGWAQNYGSEARRLVQMIFDKDHAMFRQMDNSGIEGMLSKDWVALRWNPSTKQKSDLITMISSQNGRQAQDELFAELMNKFIADCKSTYTSDVKAQMMYCEIRHLGGKNPVDRIFKRCGGSYSVDSIMNSLQQDQYDTSSSNQVGDKIFWSRHEKCREFINRYAVDESGGGDKGTQVMVSNCGCDERGSIAGGQAGDQTGNEWCLKPWYQYAPYGWQYVLRHPDRSVGQLIADLACEAAANDNVGYDQNERGTFWAQLPRAGYRPANITIPCEADCSSGASAIVKAVGYLTGNTALQNVSADNYTGSIRSALQVAGFQVLSEAKYLTSDSYLLPGDFLLREGFHICTVVSAGSETEDYDDMILEIMKNARFEFYNGQKLKTVIVDELNVRSAPSAEAPLNPYWGKLSHGNQVRGIGYTADGTWEIIGVTAGEKTGTVGYVWRDYLSE